MSDFDSSTSETSVSRSQRKREALAVRDMARRMVEMPAGELARLSIPDELVAPLQRARQTRQPVARKREIGYVAKCLRRSEALESLTAELQALDQHARRSAARFHALERLRDRLIREGDDAVNELVARHDDADRQKLRRLVRTARRELKRQQPPAASRELFRYLRELVSDPAP